MKRVLIIDDDIVIRIAFQKLLQNGDYYIEHARDVGGAINALRKNIYDLILLDMRLPPVGEKGGFQILSKKQNIPLNAETPVIIVTGQFEEEEIKKQTDLRDNIAQILLKPVDNNTLVDAVKQVLG